jgi:hypothetical protein
MDEARALFVEEQPKGDFGYFSFCGHCLTERIPNFGWEPTARDEELLAVLKQRMHDMKVLDEKPITLPEMIARMRRYTDGTIVSAELRRVIEYYKATRGDEEPDLSNLVIVTGRR